MFLLSSKKSNPTSPFGCFWKFQKCKYEHACHGAYNSEILNDTRITSTKLKELILNDSDIDSDDSFDLLGFGSDSGSDED